MTHQETQSSGSFIDDHEVAAEAQSSFSKVATIGALSLHLLVAQHQTAPLPTSELPDNITTHSTPSSTILRTGIAASEVMAEIHRVYDELLTSQVELDEDARRVLHDNQWELYG